MVMILPSHSAPSAPVADSKELHLPRIDPRGDAPRRKEAYGRGDRFHRVAERLSGDQIRALAPNLWSHLLRQCRTSISRSDAQRGRWSEYRVGIVRDRVAKTSKARLTPATLAAGLLEVAEANGVREPKLGAIAGLLKLRRDSDWCK